jgi:hypothetical protein
MGGGGTPPVAVGRWRWSRAAVNARRRAPPVAPPGTERQGGSPSTPRQPPPASGTSTLEEMSVAEVAAVMGLPERTVKSHLFRARRLLRTVLEKRMRGAGDG